MSEWAPVILFLGLPVVFVIAGFTVGWLNETRHFGRLEAGERECASILATNTGSFPPDATQASIVLSEVVIATDYSRSLFGRLRKIFGGELRGYRRMMILARREAILRLRQQAMARGFAGVANIRLQAADITGQITARKQKKLTVMCSILASGTAYQ